MQAHSAESARPESSRVGSKAPVAGTQTVDGGGSVYKPDGVSLRVVVPVPAPPHTCCMVVPAASVSW